MMHANQITRDPDRDPVEVLLGDGGSTEPARDAATEHVGQATAASLVQQDHHDEERARQDEQDAECGNHEEIPYLSEREIQS